MSSRFQRLEIGDSGQPAPPGGSPGAAPAPRPLAAEVMHDAPYWQHEADAARRHGSFEEALRKYSRAVETDRALIPAWVGQVRMLIMLEEFPEAELWARKALELFRNHPDLNAARAQALCRSGDLKNAQAASDAAIQAPGQSPYPWLARADLMLSTRDPVEEHCFNKAIQLNPDWFTRIEIAEIYFYYGRHAKALSRCQQAIAKTADQPYAWFLQGRCELAMGMTDAGRRSMRQCLDLDPKFDAARDAVASANASGGGGWLKRFFGGRK